MATEVPTVWGIHAGRSGDADALFLRNDRVAIGWPAMGDLRLLPPNREAFKTRLQDTYPNTKPGAIPPVAGLLFRFVHEMKPGDVVIYPSKVDHLIHLGLIKGEYEHAPRVSQDYPNHRAVDWVKHVSRTRFTQGALYEIGSAITLFQVRNYAAEYLAAMKGEVAVVPPEVDATLVRVAEDIEQNTRDFILKQLSQELKGHPLCDFVANLLRTMGYRTRVAEPGPDGGIDILAHRDELGFEPPIIKVQVKSSDSNVGEPVLSSLYGQVAHGEFGLLVTLGSFTPPARSFAKGKSNLRLIDGNDLVNLVLEHYDALDSPYKAVVPLKRVYVPQPLDEGED